VCRGQLLSTPLNFQIVAGLLRQDRAHRFESQRGDGRMWVPEGAARTPTPSPEEQRLAEMYKRKGLNAVMDQLRKF
jgi:hypothetical protein